MKKTIAIVLSVMLILISIAPMSFAVTPPDFAIRVVEGAYDEKAAAVTTVSQDTFTIIVKCPAVTKLVGVNAFFSYDSSVLQVVGGRECGKLNSDNNYVSYFPGTWQSGARSATEYACGFISTNGVSKTAAADLIYITLKVKDPSKTSTTVRLYLNEFRTEDGDDTNEISSQTLAGSIAVNLNITDGTTSPSDPTAPTSEATADDINGLIEIIRGMLEGNGATFSDFVDALVNVFGNADLMDMLSQLVDGDFNIADAFQRILDNFGLDFGSLEDILNKIIDFFKGLFNPDNGKKTTTNVITTMGGGNNDTTSGGSGSSSEKTGDAGIALAATVCVAAAAAFALTRKKKEIA